jgi:hypothetical protein
VTEYEQDWKNHKIIRKYLEINFDWDFFYPRPSPKTCQGTVKIAKACAAQFLRYCHIDIKAKISKLPISPGVYLQHFTRLSHCAHD